MITKPLMVILFLFAANLISMGVVAKPYVEGVDYTLVAGIPESNVPVVREFFSYHKQPRHPELCMQASSTRL